MGLETEKGRLYEAEDGRDAEESVIGAGLTMQDRTVNERRRERGRVCKCKSNSRRIRCSY